MRPRSVLAFGPGRARDRSDLHPTNAAGRFRYGPRLGPCQRWPLVGERRAIGDLRASLSAFASDIIQNVPFFSARRRSPGNHQPYRNRQALARPQDDGENRPGLETSGGVRPIAKHPRAAIKNGWQNKTLGEVLQTTDTVNPPQSPERGWSRSAQRGPGTGPICIRPRRLGAFGMGQESGLVSVRIWSGKGGLSAANGKSGINRLRVAVVAPLMVAACAALITAVRHRSDFLLGYAVAVTAGLVLSVVAGSLLEWLIHRYVYHQRVIPFLGRIFRIHHQGHHFAIFPTWRYVTNGTPRRHPSSTTASIAFIRAVGATS